MNKLQIAFMVLATAVWTATPANAADAKDRQQKAQQVLSDLHHSNQMEIEMGKMAQQKASTPQVRSYADQLVRDHQKADEQVRDLAKKQGITLEAKPADGLLEAMKNESHHNQMAELSAKTGSEFEKAFIDTMIDEHQDDISKLQDAQKSVDQTEVRQLVSTLLPKLEQHLRQAQEIQKRS